MGSRPRLGVVVCRNLPAQDDAAEIGEVLDGGLENVAAHVIEEYVDAVGAQLAETRLHILAAIVDDRVGAAGFAEPAALLLATGNTHYPATLDLRNLRDQGTYGAGGGADQYGLPAFRLAHVEKTEVGGQAGHTENAEGHGGWGTLRQRHWRHGVVWPRHGILLPAIETLYE